MGTINDDLLRLRASIDELGASGEDRLPSEPKLSESLGVSRGRLRTLLKRLEDEGVIWRHVGKGTFIGPRHLTIADQKGAISVDDIIAARLLLEPQLAAQAAIHATPTDIAAMDSCLAEMSRTTSFAQWKRLDERLHRIIAEATHNILLVMLYDTLRSVVRESLDDRMTDVFGPQLRPRRITDDEHSLFIESIRAHNPAAAEHAMRAHIQSVRSALFGLHSV